MSILIRHITDEHQGLRLEATSSAVRRGLPRTYPFSATWASYPLSSITNDYHTLIAYGPSTFSGANYYTAAIVIGGSGPVWSVGANGTDVTGDVVATERWFYQGFRAFITGTTRRHEFYYDLPDTSKLNQLDVAGSYFANPTSDAFLGIGDVAWANHEAFEGMIASIKMWNAKLSPAELMIESRSPWPVLPQYAHALWDILPLRTLEDRNVTRIRKVNNRRWNPPNVSPATDGRQPVQFRRTTWWLPNAADIAAEVAAGAASARSRFLPSLGVA